MSAESLINRCYALLTTESELAKLREFANAFKTYVIDVDGCKVSVSSSYLLNGALVIELSFTKNVFLSLKKVHSAGFEQSEQGSITFYDVKTKWTLWTRH